MAPNDVELIGHYGGDLTHALSAWTSTERELTDEKRQRVGGLLTALAQNTPPHTTPFEKSMLHFLVRCETASQIHLLKHRIAVSVNGESARYKQLRAPTHYLPGDWPAEFADRLHEWCKLGQLHYEQALAELEPLLGRKRAKESARFFLPYANQLTFDVSFNFKSFVHFVTLRHHRDAQREIDDIAAAMLDLVRETGDFDLSLAAFDL